MPRFATAALRRTSGAGAAWRYLRHVAPTGPGVPGELAAAASPMLPPAGRARTYWALANPSHPVAGVLTDGFQDVADTWTATWTAAAVAAHARHRRSWSEADMWDSVWPHDPLLPAGPVPEVSPFLYPAMLAAAPTPAGRYRAELQTAYQRCKAAVVALFPPHVQPALPSRKQYFSTVPRRPRQPGGPGWSGRSRPG